MNIRRFLFVLRLLLAGVFLYAAWTKLRQPWLMFAMSIDAYQVLPEWAVLTLARVLPWLEAALGVVLAIGWQLRWSSLLSAALLAGFLVLMIVTYAKGMRIDCGCFGVGEPMGPWTLARDGSLTFAAAALTAFSWRRT